MDRVSNVYFHILNVGHEQAGGKVILDPVCKTASWMGKKNSSRKLLEELLELSENDN